MKSSFKTDSKPAGRPKDPVKTAFKHLCRLTDTPKAQRILGNWDTDLSLLAQLKIDPADYTESETFRKDYLLISFLSKYKGLQTGINTKEVALSSFAAGEAQCRDTNRRIRAGKPSFVDSILYRAQQLVSKLLGSFDSRKLDGQERWGPGASSDLKRAEAYLDTKIAKLPITVTASCLPFFRRAIKSDLHWSQLILGVFPEGPFSLLDSVFEVVPGSRITTVPKNAKTDRTIAIEPRGNMFMQKAAGRYLRSRLKRFGVDLDDQGLNQRLASEGQKLNLATIDLSMASDSVSRQLVLMLLPLDWFLYFDSLRSKCYSIGDGENCYFEKFSSMGNGFTFELESLIFWALAKASMKDETGALAIYGDDIIVPSSDAHVLIMTLSYCGFSTNDDKSFIEGRFRESCGRHYFDGIDVTPIYQKELITTEASHRRFLNRLSRYAAKNHTGDKLETITGRVWRRLYDQIRFDWHPQIPMGTEGDDGYLVTHDLVKLSRAKPSYGHKWEVIVSRPVRIPADERALLAYALRLNSSENSPVRVLPPGFTEIMGCSEGTPTYGDLISTDKEAVAYSRATRWIEPPWQFALEST